MREDRPRLSRRGMLAGAGAVAVGALGTWQAEPAAAEPQAAGFGAVAIRPGDTRYESFIRGNNFRFVGRPDEIRVIGSTDQVMRAVSDAVRSGRRVAVRSGGHCFENFTADPEIRVLLDLSPMDAVCYDPQMRAFAVQPGARLGHVYRTLFTNWGVTIPAGGCPDVGAGGHIAGGGYGPLSRRYGSVVDHVYGVEVVAVDSDGRVRPVVATREPNDPNRDLWWAHTGGGGGNFGVVTKYWLRSANATGTDPSRLLPPAPAQMLEGLANWSWKDLTKDTFLMLVRNFGTWVERNSAPDSPYVGLYPLLFATHQKGEGVTLVVQTDAGIPNVQDKVMALLGAVSEGLPPNTGFVKTMPWLHGLTWPGLGEAGDVITRRYKLKAGYLRKSFNETQLEAIYRNMTNATGTSNSGMLMIGYGGQVRTVSPTATALAQRDVVMKAVYQSVWTEDTEKDDTDNITWVRNLYRDVYAETGGVPVPNDISDGSYINYPDVDLADPAWNTSGVPWSTLYYKDNYPRLQQIKARWDPRNVFHHALAIEPA